MSLSSFARPDSRGDYPYILSALVMQACRVLTCAVVSISFLRQHERICFHPTL